MDEIKAEDNYDLERFVAAQEGVFDTVLAELRAGSKQSHWMWFIFPQISGLGSSPMARRYAICSIEEAEAYLNHPLLGQRLMECCRILLSLDQANAEEIFGFPDEMKLRSCLTLFEQVSAKPNVFADLLAKYFDGNPDPKTLERLEQSGAAPRF